MKLPLLNILRTSKVFAVVLGLHLFVLSLLLFHPGCQKTSGAAPAEAAAPMGETSSLENATLAEPTRPVDSVANTSLNENAAASSSVVTSEPLPAPVALQTYAVQKGDSLWSIAKKNGVTINALLETNNLTRDSALKVGQSLKIPAASSQTLSNPATAGSVEGQDKPSSATSYKVEAGDSLARIAKAHGVTVRALKKANKLHSDSIRVGQNLKIPGKKQSSEASSQTLSIPATAGSVEGQDKTSTEGTSTYIVQKGDSPATIAKKNGMKLSELVTLNNITDPRKLKIGQELKVKASATAPEATTTAPEAKPMSVAALEAATATSSEASAPVVEVKSDTKTAATVK